MRKSYKFKKRAKPEKRFYCNQQIRTREVMAVDENEQSLGVMETAKAVAMAHERGFDLVEVSPNANPPVAKFLNYGSFQYQREKLLKKQKKQGKSLDVKSVRLSMKIGEHDKQTKLKQAEKFLSKGHKLKIELILKGRERQYINLAKENIREFKKLLTTPHQIEQDITKQGYKLFLIIMPDK